MNSIQQTQKILFYDGDCGYCHAVVMMVLKYDRRRNIHFSPLQGEQAKNLVPVNLRQKLDTIIYVRRGELYTKSEAIRHLLQDIGGPLSIAAKVLWIIPIFLANWGYDFVARHRQTISANFFKTCTLPSIDDRKRFLP